MLRALAAINSDLADWVAFRLDITPPHDANPLVPPKFRQGEQVTDGEDAGIVVNAYCVGGVWYYKIETPDEIIGDVAEIDLRRVT